VYCPTTAPVLSAANGTVVTAPGTSIVV
jgi:hypothetical protein